MLSEEMKIKRGKTMYIIEAALEYLVSILVGTSFLAKLTKEIGFSDSLTGILSSIISLGCLFQLCSVTMHRKKVKSFVIVMSISNQLLFMFLYVIPLIDISKTAKSVIFIIFIISAYFIYNFAHPKKISWLMSLVENEHRGTFTANKEIISLITGMTFTYLAGNMVDRFSDAGNIRGAFIVSAIVIFILMILHTLTMVFTVEKEMTMPEREPLRDTVKHLFKNKNILYIIVIFAINNIGRYAATPFFGTYAIGELGFTLTFVSVLSIIESVTRIFVSKFWGRYADKHSFIIMIKKCFIFLALAYLCAAFAVPENGKVMFVLYYALHGIAQGGITSAQINLVFDYVPEKQRADSLAICQAISGVIGFVTTIIVSPVVTIVQNNENEVLGIPIYAQQLLSSFSFIVTLIGIAYIHFHPKKKS